MNVTDAGEKVTEVAVQIGPQFLHLFSEQLYSSPNKAFEELISNSWDADATKVYVHIPPNLQEDNASIWTWDNGTSMDISGFHDLWAVATSRKRDTTGRSRRKQIGKFGVGKLATYLLADELTYVCKAADGVIRAVTMDYRRIDNQREGVLHIEPLPLDVRVIPASEIENLFSTVSNPARLISLIRDPAATDFSDPEFRDEYGGEHGPRPTPAGTWTVAIMTSLKPKGRSLSNGWIRRLLRTALPLGSSISIVLNDEILTSAKSSVEVWKEWKIGENFVPDDLLLEDGSKASVTVGSTSYPSIYVDGIGEVTGTIRLYSDRITGGKSDDILVSNGFFVNVRGRVLKPEDPYFGLQNLSHSAWAQFRAAVRADGLDDLLAVNRESVLSGLNLAFFQGPSFKDV